MIYTDNKGRTLDVTVWDGSDVTEDVLGAPRTGADLDLLVETARNYAYGRGGFDLPEAEVRADWTLTGTPSCSSASALALLACFI